MRFCLRVILAYETFTSWSVRVYVLILPVYIYEIFTLIHVSALSDIVSKFQNKERLLIMKKSVTAVTGTEQAAHQKGCYYGPHT